MMHYWIVQGRVGSCDTRFSWRLGFLCTCEVLCGAAIALLDVQGKKGWGC
jgi:hypothetical protein